jgi:transcriptional regulator with XRE-family HTH domain
MAKGFQHRRNDTAISTLAGNIRKYRQARNLTIVELADLIEVDYSQISRMERGTVNANISIVFDIAAALNIHPGQLLELSP